MDRWPLSYSTIDHIQIDMSGIKYVIGPISICNFFLNCVTSSINTEWLINNLYSALYFCHSLKFVFELILWTYYYQDFANTKMVGKRC